MALSRSHGAHARRDMLGIPRNPFKRARNAFTSSCPLTSSYSLTPMDSRYYYESYNPGYGDAGFPVSDADYHPLDRHPDIPISLAVVPPTPYAAVWDHGLRQTPGTFHMTSSADPTSPYESGGDYSLIGSQSVEIYSEPTGIYPAQAQVSPAAVSHVEAPIRRVSAIPPIVHGKGHTDL